jgi:hypothetical protein
MPLAALPEELVRNLIIRKYVVGDSPPTENILAVRAACKMFWKAVPVGMLLGLKDGTPKWLFGGETEQWDQSKNTTNLYVLLHSSTDTTEANKRMHVVCDSSSEKTSHKNEAIHLAQIGSSQMHSNLFIKSSLLTSLHMQMHANYEMGRTKNTNENFAAVWCWNNVYYLASHEGHVYKIDPMHQWMNPESFPLINHATDLVHKWDIPTHAKSIRGCFECRAFETINGKDFWFCTESRHLLFGTSINANGQLITLAGNVESFELIDDAAVCMMTDGSVKLLTRKHHAGAQKFVVNVVAYGMINFTITKYPVYSIWFKNNSNQYFRRGLPLNTVQVVSQNDKPTDERPVKRAKIEFISNLLLAAVSDMQTDLNVLADETRAMASSATQR